MKEKKKEKYIDRWNKQTKIREKKKKKYEWMKERKLTGKGFGV